MILTTTSLVSSYTPASDGQAGIHRVPHQGARVPQLQSVQIHARGARKVSLIPVVSKISKTA